MSSVQLKVPTCKMRQVVTNLTNVMVKHKHRSQFFTTSHHILVIYFNYVYYLGLTPYRFKLASSGEYVLHSNYFQKVLCGTLHLFLTVYTVYKIVVFVRVVDVNENPSHILHAWRIIYWGAGVPAWAIAVWRNKLGFAKIFDISQAPSDLREMFKNAQRSIRSLENQINWHWVNGVFVHIFIITVLATSPLTEIGRRFFVPCTYDRQLLQTLNMLNSINETESYRYTISFDSNPLSLALEILFLVHISVLGQFVSIIFGIAALVFLQLSVEFDRCLDNRETEFEAVLDRYIATQEIIGNLNKGVSWLIFLRIIAFITTHSYLVLNLFGCKNWLRNALEIFWFVIAVVELLLAAEANLKMNKIKNWILARILTRRVNDLPSSTQIQMHTQYIHVCDDPIALKGGQLFRITYGSIGSGLGLLVTYTIITLQFATTDKSIVVPK